MVVALLNAFSRCRFCIYPLVVGVVIFSVPQGSDALVSLEGFTPTLTFLLLSAAWSIVLWLVARRMLTVPLKVGDTYIMGGVGGPGPSIIRWVPRAFAVSVFALFVSVSLRYALFQLAIKTTVAGVVVLAILICRRKIQGWMTGSGFLAASDYYNTQQTGEADIPTETPWQALCRFFGHDRETRKFWFVLLPVVVWGIIAFILTQTIPTTQYVNASHVVIMQLTVYTLIGSLGFFVATRFRFPVLITLIIWISFASLFNDNHELRTLPGKQPKPRAQLNDYTQEWIQSHSSTPLTRGRIPLVMVVSEGGGIRAAYWTAAVLNSIHSQTESVLATNLFAMTSVSGGSFGCAAYLSGTRINNRGKVLKFLGQDYLTPGLSALLDRETIQQLIPYPINAFDRARPFEKGFEYGWQQVMLDGNSDPSNDFALPFLSFWQRQEKEEPLQPLLILNSTVLETGQRAIISPVQLPKDRFLDAIDFFDFAKKRFQSIPLSTALHGSARFPFFSPPGTFDTRSIDGENRHSLHLIDGGYFDNSGATTAADLLENLRSNTEWRSKIIPVVITVAYSLRDRAADERASGSSPSHLLHELTSPPLGVYHAWDGYTYYSTQRLRKIVEEWDANTEGLFFEASLQQKDDKTKYVLGWSLSNTQQGELNKAALASAEDFSRAYAKWAKP